MKHLKDFIALPFFGIFLVGCCIAMIGWIAIEFINGEHIKEIKIVKNDRIETEQKA